ncbi:MAG: YkvA family protein [Prevotella sp.]|jgi:uncharacterized membrane protein YkvA (DUF1232 family)|nr:YkvA family protein [Prevotella sp.]
MDINEILNYKDKFSQSAFLEKISRIAKRAGAKLIYAALILYYTLQSDKVSLKDKAIILGALGYLISPLDVVPDAIPIAGLGDDLAVLIFVLKKVWGEVNDDVRAKAKSKLSRWFDEDELKDVDDLFSQKPEDTPI